MKNMKLPLRQAIRCSTRQSHRCFSTTRPAQANAVRIIEVGPRDGLQNERSKLELQTKLDLINRLSKTGVEDVEAGSFVSPKWVPQMANSAEVMNHILNHPPSSPAAIVYNFLVPNKKGLENYLKALNEPSASANEPSTPPPSTNSSEKTEEPAPITSTSNPNGMPFTPSSSQNQEPAPITSTSDPNAMPSISPSTPKHTTDISIFVSATESFSRANTNNTIASSLETAQSIISRAKPLSIRVRGYISCCLGCPYEGLDVSPSNVARIATSLLEYGVDSVSIADTIGTGTAPRTTELLKTLFAAGIAPGHLALHFHDTYGQALMNTVVGLEHGIRTFDSAVGGLGGCPFAGQATGNVSTEDLVYMLHSLGMSTGVDVEELSRIGAWICGKLGRAHDSRAGKAILSKLKKDSSTPIATSKCFS